MEQFFTLLTTYGPYLGIVFGIGALMKGLKKAFSPYFKSKVGLRTSFLIPLVLGAAGGLLLSLPLKEGLLVGIALGAVSHHIYKFVTHTLAKGDQLEEKLTRKTLDLKEVKSNKVLVDKLVDDTIDE